MMEPTNEAIPNPVINNSKQNITKSIQQKIHFAILPLLIAVMAGVVYLVFKHSPISVDASYYLVIAREIANGVTPYLEIEVVYTPLALYVNSILFTVSKGFYYSSFILLQLIVVTGCASILYIIFRKKFELTKWNSFLLSIMLFAAILSFEGYYIVTEPYIILFILLTFYLIYNAQNSLSYILGGISLSFSFFSKQYGVLAILPFVILVLFQAEKKINAIYFMAAYSLSILLFFLLFSKGDMGLLFDQLFASPFTKKSKKLLNIPSAISLLVVSKIFLCLIIPLILRYFKTGFPINYVVGFALSGIIIYLSPLLLNQNQHHFINTLPFIFIAYGYTIKKDDLLTYEYFLMGLLFLLFSSVTINRLFIHAYKKEEQFRVSKYAFQHFKEGESVFLMGQYRNLYLLNNYQNPLKKNLGYTWDYKRMEQKKKELNKINVIFSFCFEKQLFIDSLRVKPAKFLTIENCPYNNE